MDINSEHQKVLIIDDETDICFLLSNILKRKNFSIKTANSIADAKLLLSEGAPHIVFLDNHLGDGMGVDFIPEIKQTYPKAKVIMISAYDDAESRTKAKNNGVDDFIAKPLFTNAIDNALSKFAS